jgi:hypothetical protein
MRGQHEITVRNARVQYKFTVSRNITILRGDSATGKTTLIEMIAAHQRGGERSGVEFRSDKPCVVLTEQNWELMLSAIRDSIVFIDEGNPFVFSDAFSEAIQQTDNYYVIVSREGLPNLPYSVTEIYGIRSSGKYGGLKQHYHEFYRIYGEDITGGADPHSGAAAAAVVGLGVVAVNPAQEPAAVGTGGIGVSVAPFLHGIGHSTADFLLRPAQRVQQRLRHCNGQD